MWLSGYFCRQTVLFQSTSHFFLYTQHLTSAAWLRVHFSKAFSVFTINTHTRPFQIREFCEQEIKCEKHQLGFHPPLTSITSMNVLRIAIFKRYPSFPPRRRLIILHLHDKCVCLCTHLCMYGWVLKRTLAAAGHEFLSFISTSRMGRGLFNVKSGWLSLCSSSECSSLATVRRRALKWSQGLTMWNSYDTKATYLCVFACASTYIYLFPPSKSFIFLHLHVNSCKCFHLPVVWRLCSSAVMMLVIIGEELFFFFKLRHVMFFFSEDRNVLMAPHASQTLLMEKCKYSNRRKHKKHKLAKWV